MEWREGELWTVEIDRQSLLLGVDIGNTRVVVDAHRCLGGADFLHFLARVHLEIMQVAHGAVALPSHSRIESESPVGLIDEAATSVAGRGYIWSCVAARMVMKKLSLLCSRLSSDGEVIS